MTLHIISRSPFQHSALQECLKVAGDQDAIILTEDGSYACLDSQQSKLEHFQTQGAAFVLGNDLEARGLEAPDGIKALSTDEFVTLCTQHSPIQSWF